MRSAPSGRADHFLATAIGSNYAGDTELAAQSALRARLLYTRGGNVAGASRSEAELIYSLRRQSKSPTCLANLDLLNHLLRNRKYKWLEVEAAYETSVCQTMSSNFDIAWTYARLSVQRAEAAGYPSDALRAQSAETGLDTSEGRISNAWLLEQEGLDLFWSGAYRAERAFQLYSDLEEVSAQAGQWHLSAVLQQEAIKMLDETERTDFKAIAHFRLGLILEKSGERQKAQEELVQAGLLFDKLPANGTTAFYRAFGEVELARLETAENPASSEQRLRHAGPAVSQARNVLVQMPYYQALADVDRQLKRPVEEIKHLQEGIRIGRRGLSSLKTEQARWQQQQQIDVLYHLLLELHLESSQAPAQTLAEWESSRALQLTGSSATRMLRTSYAQNSLLHTRLKSLKHSTLVSFAVFQGWTNVWIADDRGVQRAALRINAESLQREVARFLTFCSDPSIPIEKVNSSGHRLYQLLFEPVEHFLEPDRMLLIEEDGALHNIPWSALSITNGIYLGDRYTLAITPGLFYGPVQRFQTTSTNGVLLVYPGAVSIAGRTYPPLPDAEREIAYIASLTPATRLEEDAATLDHVLHAMRNSSIFYFAGHAEARAAGDTLLLRDGALSASDVRKMPLHNMQLAVLSACSTGLATGDASRDPNGLVRAFLAAGAHQVVATHWDVDSRGSFAFSKAFYATLVSTHDVPAAMSAARKAIRSDPHMLHPFYWSAFEVFGTAH